SSPTAAISISVNADPDLADLIRFYMETGARTAEALTANVADFWPRSRTITLGKGKHKNAGKGKIRVITLSPEAYEIVSRRSVGKGATDPIFTTRRTGRRWRMHNLSEAWKRLRKKASVRGTITPYSFRHLWATDAIESNVPIATVAKMMGSSAAVVERYY